MHLLCHIGSAYAIAVLVIHTHVKLRHTTELAALSHQLKHLFDILLAVVQFVVTHTAREVHLRAYTVNLSNSVSLPFLYPVDERPELLVVIPEAFEVVVVDKELNVLGTILACKTHCLTHIFEVAHIVLPVEGVAAHIPGAIRVIAFGVLQGVVAFTVVAAARDGLVHHIPCLHLAVTCLHHAFYPLVHGIY